MDFSGGAGQQSNTDLIPNNQLCWVIVNYRGMKRSANTGTQYLDVELTVDDNQPFARRKVWTNIMDPMFGENSEGAKQMGMIAITRMLEAGRNAGPHNQAGYQITDYQLLDGLRVAVKIGIEKGTGGYADKNKVAEWLTPNPESKSGNKGWVQLQAGQRNSDPNAGAGARPAATGGFGAAKPQGNLFPPQQPQPGAAQPSPATTAAPAPQENATPPVVSPSSGGWGKPAVAVQPTPPPPGVGGAPGWITRPAS